MKAAFSDSCVTGSSGRQATAALAHWTLHWHWRTGQRAGHQRQQGAHAAGAAGYGAGTQAASAAWQSWRKASDLATLPSWSSATTASWVGMATQKGMVQLRRGVVGVG